MKTYQVFSIMRLLCWIATPKGLQQIHENKFGHEDSTHLKFVKHWTFQDFIFPRSQSQFPHLWLASWWQHWRRHERWHIQYWLGILRHSNSKRVKEGLLGIELVVVACNHTNERMLMQERAWNQGTGKDIDSVRGVAAWIEGICPVAHHVWWHPSSSAPQLSSCILLRTRSHCFVRWGCQWFPCRRHGTNIFQISVVDRQWQ